MTELTEDQKTVLNHEKKKYDRQLKAWAVDRAIELAKINGQYYPKDITDAAEHMCAWIYETEQFVEVPDAQEASDMVQDAAHNGVPLN